jgi:hypothetical protein
MDFDAMSYSQDILAELIVEIFIEVSLNPVLSDIWDFRLTEFPKQLELDTRLGLNRSTLESFVVSVRSRMLENPYHNWVHACDVVQVIFAKRS